jgi:hypothetical protein
MKNKTILAVIAVLTLGAAITNAQEVCTNIAGIISGACIVFFVFKFLFEGLLRLFFGATAMLIQMNPDLTVINPMFMTFIGFLEPIFLLSIVLTVFYLLFMSGSPAGRARAKDMLRKLLICMIAVTLSPQIFQIMMDLCYAMTMHFLSAGVQIDMSDTMIGAFFFVGIGLIPIMVVIWALTLVSIAIRWIGVLIMASLFPMTIFFHFFEPPLIGGITKSAGRTMWRWTVGFLLAQPAQGLMLAITMIGFNGVKLLGADPVANFAANYLSYLMAIAGMMMVIIAPLMMMQLLEWVGGALMAIGMSVSLSGGTVGIAAGGAMTAAGGMMMGMGSSSMMAAGGAMSQSYAAHRSKKAYGGHSGGGDGKKKSH